MAKARCVHGVLWYRDDCPACRYAASADAWVDPMPWWLRALTVSWLTTPSLGCRILE